MDKTYSFEELLEENGYIVYTNVGRSMMPLLRQHRDIIEIRKKGKERFRRYDTVLYKRGEKYILHRIVKVRPGDYVILGDNCILKEYGITDDQILGIMTRVIRDGRSVYTTSWKYRLYSRVWVSLYPVRVMFRSIKARIKGIIRKRRQRSKQL